MTTRSVLDTGMILPSPEELERAMRLGNRERAEMADTLWKAVAEALVQVSQPLTSWLQSGRFTPDAVIVSEPIATATKPS